jgi:tetratricopeptide (TPR) repeat protein
MMIHMFIAACLALTSLSPCPSMDIAAPPRLLAQTRPSDWLLSGLEKVRKRDFQGAIADYTQALKLDPEYEKAYYNRGLAYLDIGELEQAVNDFSRTLQLDSQHARAHYHRGRTLILMERWEEAGGDFTRAIELDPAYANAYRRRGDVLVQLNRTEAAISDYRKAAELLIQENERDAAEKILEKIKELQS